MHNQVISFFKKFIDLDEKTCEAIRERSKIKHFSKNEFLLTEGKTCSFVAFINKGAFRAFYSVNGQEYSKQFFFEGNFCTDYSSYLTQKKSFTYLQAIEESTVIIFQKKDALQWVNALNCLSVGNQNWAMDTSLLICVCANKRFKHNGNENKWSQYDTGAASENICLQSTYLGLAAHQMGGFDSDKIRNLANIPVEFDVMSFIAVGKPLAKKLMTVEQVEAEGSARKRLKLNEIYFENKWDNFEG